MSLSVSSPHHILPKQSLIQIAIDSKEAVVSTNGAIAVTTGARTGRSPKDRFIVCDQNTQPLVDWGAVNQPIEPVVFDRLWQKAIAYLDQVDTYGAQLQVGADANYGMPVTVVCELAWHVVVAHNLFLPCTVPITCENEWTLINAARLKLDPEEEGVRTDGVVVIDFTQRKVLIIGIEYAGEMKKAMFTALNYKLPEYQILPMHCAANMGAQGDTALFFGLSGTGKTTLSADPERHLIGDDEHGWSQNTVFNFEGGCYAKCIDLSEEREPVIYHAIRSGAVMENVVLNQAMTPDYSDKSLTENTRVAYPRTHIDGCVIENQGPPPRVVIFLSCDLHGVLPPVSMLSLDQAAYYFLSGYTALVGSTEMGQKQGVRATFSTCFGAPFFPRRPEVYADLLKMRVSQAGARVYLVNTGWTGGAYAAGGERFSIPVTRKIIQAIVSGDIERATTAIVPGFNLAVPTHLDGIDAQLLRPAETWASKAAYQKEAQCLISAFQQNFSQFTVPPSVLAAGPQDL